MSFCTRKFNFYVEIFISGYSMFLNVRIGERILRRLVTCAKAYRRACRIQPLIKEKCFPFLRQACYVRESVPKGLSYSISYLGNMFSLPGAERKFCRIPPTRKVDYIRYLFKNPLWNLFSFTTVVYRLTRKSNENSSYLTSYLENTFPSLR